MSYIYAVGPDGKTYRINTTEYKAFREAVERLDSDILHNAVRKCNGFERSLDIYLEYCKHQNKVEDFKDVIDAFMGEYARFEDIIRDIYDLPSYIPARAVDWEFWFDQLDLTCVDTPRGMLIFNKF